MPTNQEEASFTPPEANREQLEEELNNLNRDIADAYEGLLSATAEDIKNMERRRDEIKAELKKTQNV